MTLITNQLIGFGAHKPLLLTRFVRINVTTINGGEYLAINEIDVVSGGTDYPVASMTAMTEAGPPALECTVSGTYSNNYGWMAFNDVNDGGWYSNTTTGWITIDLGAGYEVVVESVKIQAHASVGATYSPKDFTILLSPTGAFAGEETTFATVTNETSWANSEVKTYTG